MIHVSTLLTKQRIFFSDWEIFFLFVCVSLCWKLINNYTEMEEIDRASVNVASLGLISFVEVLFWVGWEGIGVGVGFCFYSGNSCNCQRNGLFIEQRLIKVGRLYRSSGQAPSQADQLLQAVLNFPPEFWIFQMVDSPGNVLQHLATLTVNQRC